MIVHPAALDRPELPVIAEPLELAVTADAAARSGFDQMLVELGVLLEHVLRLVGPAAWARPRPTPPGLGVEFLRRREVPQLGIARGVLTGVVVVLGPRPAIRHQEGRRVGGTRRLEQLNDVVVHRVERNRVFDPGVSVHRVSHVQHELEPALRGGHQL